jgi:hypothetical protein
LRGKGPPILVYISRDRIYYVHAGIRYILLAMNLRHYHVRGDTSHACDVVAEAAQGRQSKRNPAAQVLGKRSRSQELEEAEQETKALKVAEYCSILNFE